MVISTTGVVLFITAWFGVVLGGVFSLIEAVATARFSPWPYRLGPLLFRRRRAMPAPLFRLDASLPEETESGLFKMIAPGEGLFHARITDFQWPFWPLPRPPFERFLPKGSGKGTIRWRGAEAEVEARLSLGAIISGTAWVAAVTVWAIIAMPDPELHRIALIALAVGWGFALGIIALSIRQDRRRMFRVLDELDKWFGRAAA